MGKLRQVYAFFLIFMIFGSSFCKQEVDSLKDHFEPYFKIGTSVSPGELDYAADFITHHYNSITPENELKPDAILDQWASQQFGQNVNPQVHLNDGTRKTLQFCQDHGIALRGHTFIWHSQTPQWLFKNNFNDWEGNVSADIMTLRLENFIKNTFALLKQEFPYLNVYAYDVANEVFDDNGGLRQWSMWMDIYHDDSFLIYGFTFARKYAPEGCKLYINDYNEYMGPKTQSMYDEAMKLKGLGIIDGIGMQSHLDQGFPSPQQHKDALAKFASTGLDVILTELDMTCSDWNVQGDLYGQIFHNLVEYADSISAVTFWGTTDERSWRSQGNPLIFHNYEPKPAYWSVMSAGNDQ